jgi:PTH1 family peptidyl-tRNA hydrolase
MRIVAGLGNPGRKYQRTRHNVGFDVVDELARRHQLGSWRQKFDADINEIWLDGNKLLLVKPLTFMNASGRSIGRLVEFFQLELHNLAVICDDMSLETGRLRWRGAGSSGGQKGLADVARHLGTQEFARLRIGIDRPPGQMDPADYVLGRFRTSEQDIMEHAIVAAADSVALWVSKGIDAAMNRFNPKSA